ncbi:hypothetical protein WH367_16565 [Comamonas sp. MYb21]|uniref:hypothetical protein n=1 Tax=Comamonas sp. MYb21 TaxID=1848648 RepID=UPI003098770A
MNIIQMLALAEREQHIERARMLGSLVSVDAAPCQVRVEPEFEELDLEQIPQFWVSDYRREA